ncbi:ICOS ligand isoform X1 [Varanus komodoensis]|uniref:ICOS ligand isoform X1 n=1 Tax=Varanus komodoensis TaxID=61221 RepID=UPI001CF7AE99|nr:ICOS ligand isoform X1 [Varanus komodoensis]
MDAARSLLGLMVLFIWIQRIANEHIVHGIIGNAAELKCQYTGEPFILNQFRIQWQKKGETKCFVDAYFPNQDMREHQCAQFRNRTQADPQRKEDDFTLKLLNLSPKDELTYECVVQRNKSGRYEVIHSADITLQVAASYSKPKLVGPVQSGKEMTFFCHSSHGYPQQKLHWINQTDNSFLNGTENVTEEPDGKFSINSTLTIEASTNTILGCKIENKWMNQSTTTTIDLNASRSSPIHLDQHNTFIVLGAVALIAVALVFILCSWLVKRNSSFPSAYVGVCENEEAANANGKEKFFPNAVILLK